MSFPRLIFIASLLVFLGIGAVGLYKRLMTKTEKSVAVAPLPVKKEIPKVSQSTTPVDVASDFPAIDRLFELFTTGPMKLPIVETLVYSSKVPWTNGKLAWIADYASHYSTSRHFIARSLNGKPDYFSQTIREGSRFNVLKREKKLQFYLLVDVTRAKMGFYYLDLDTNERVLLKTYSVGLGRKEEGTCLTPLGKFTLGEKVAVYQPGTVDFHQNQKMEMIQVFGTRWLPMGELTEGKIAFKGYGIQGAPWVRDPKTGEIRENRSVIGAFNSDGCIRMAQEDIEELYAIVVSRPTIVEVVKDFKEAKLPGIEVASPKR